MDALFVVAAAVAIVATFLAITRANVVHALLYLAVSLLAVAVLFFLLGAPFAAALEVIIYAGAIIVLFLFVVMLLNVGPEGVEKEREWIRPRTWIGPSILAAILFVELILLLRGGLPAVAADAAIPPNEVGIALMGPYLL
ncbi:MAG: NADH-quinone oxidoreductase subunit J, partial [Candidatus Latescibacteria bacterium]|nr:NADH-quinone oxidoreductase subunit J [Candidatus Latescibacterota bacterium]